MGTGVMNIDPDAYYFIPQIFDTYIEEYDEEHDGNKHIREWYDFIVSKQLGVVPCVSHDVYYRIVDHKQFLMIVVQLGITIDDETPRSRKPGIIPV